MKHKLRYGEICFFLLVLGLIVVISGCTISHGIYSSDVLQEKNKLQQIIVLIDARAGYGYPNNSRAYSFCRASSQRLMERYLEFIKPGFLQKGYNVVDVIPVGLILLGPATLNYFPDPWIFKDFSAEERVSISTAPNQFVYTYQNNLSEFETEAARRLFIEVENAHLATSYKSYKLSHQDLITVAEKRGADTICFAIINGHYFKTTAIEILRHGPFAAKPDSESFGAYIVDVETGKILWGGAQQGGRGDNAPQNRIKGTLSTLPSRN